MGKTRSLLLAAALILTGCATSPTEYDLYVQKCHDKGGVVSLTNATAWVNTYKCAGDKGELLARYGGQ